MTTVETVAAVVAVPFALLYLASLVAVIRDVLRRSVCGQELGGWSLGLIVGAVGTTACLLITNPVTL